MLTAYHLVASFDEHCSASANDRRLEWNHARLSHPIDASRWIFKASESNAEWNRGRVWGCQTIVRRNCLAPKLSYGKRLYLYMDILSELPGFILSLKVHNITVNNCIWWKRAYLESSSIPACRNLILELFEQVKYLICLHSLSSWSEVKLFLLQIKCRSCLHFLSSGSEVKLFLLQIKSRSCLHSLSSGSDVNLLFQQDNFVSCLHSLSSWSEVKLLYPQ